ncbi:MAG: NADH-quinone oxidoreductase subunit J [Panacagrimonas sp.]
MELTFYIAGAVAILSTACVVTSPNPVHALLYLVLSLLSLAAVFLSLGAPFAAALEVIVYAGAIMVLFIFVVMMLNLGDQVVNQERAWLSPRAWLFPSLLSGVLLAELMRAILSTESHPLAMQTIDAKQVGILLYGPYLLAVELASMLLLAGLVAAYHLGKPQQPRAVRKPEPCE